MSVVTPEKGDIVLFGSYVKTKAQTNYHLVPNYGTYGVVVDSTTNQVAIVSSGGIVIAQTQGVLGVGQDLSGLTVQFVGNPF